MFIKNRQSLPKLLLAWSLMISPAFAIDLFDPGSYFHTTSNLNMTAGDSGFFEHKLVNAEMDEPIPALTIQYFLSTDRALEEADIYLGQIKTDQQPDLRDLDLRFDFQLPTSLPADNYFLHWTFEFGGDNNPSDNQAFSRDRFIVLAAPVFDLEPHGEDSAFLSTARLPGSTVAAYASVKNLGPSRSSGFEVQWLLSPDNLFSPGNVIPIANYTSGSVDPSVVGSPPITVRVGNGNIGLPTDIAPGDYRVGFRITSANDSRQTNNLYVFPDDLTILDPNPPTGSPDLQLAGSGLTGIDSATPAQGGSLRFTSALKNFGTNVTGEYTARFYARPLDFFGIPSGDGSEDISLASVEYPSLSANEVQQVSVDLPMFPLSTEIRYIIYWTFEVAGDATPANDLLFISPFQPSDADIELLNVSLEREDNGPLQRIIAESPFLFYVVATVQNHTAVATEFQLRLKAQRQNSSNRPLSVYVRDFSESSAFYLPISTVTLPDAAEIFNLEPFEQVTVRIPVSPVNFIGWTNHYRAREVNLLYDFRGSFRSGHRYDISVVASALSPSDPDLIIADATPENNEWTDDVYVRPFLNDEYDLSLGQSEVPWSIEYAPGSDYPTVTFDGTGRFYGYRDEMGIPLIQLYANGVPFGPSQLVSATDFRYRASAVSVTRTLPSNFPAVPTQFSARLFNPNANFPEIRLSNNESINESFVSVGESTGSGVDLADEGTGFHEIPAVLNPGASSSPMQFGVANIGQQDAPDQSTVSVYLSDDATLDPASDYQVGTIAIPALTAGGFHTVSLTLSAPNDVPSGDYHVIWELNSGNDFDESTTANNIIVAAAPTRVGVLTNLKAGSTPFSFAQSTVDVGAPIRVIGSRRNSGNTAIGHHRNALIFTPVSGGVEDAIIYSPEILHHEEGETPAFAHQQINAAMVPPAGLVPGIYTCRFVFDYFNQVAEDYEFDNSVTMPGLVVTDPANPFRPEIVTFFLYDSGEGLIEWTTRADFKYRVMFTPDLQTEWQPASPDIFSGETGRIRSMGFSPEAFGANPSSLFFRVDELQ